MKKYPITAIVFLMLTCLSWADVFVPAQSLKITVSEIDFYNSTTGQWVTAGTGTATFDIASVSPDQAIGNYISGAHLPNGTYTQIKLIVGRTMQLEASDTTNGYYTNGGTESNPNMGDPGSDVAILSTSAGSLATGSVHTTNNTGSNPESGEYSQDIGGTDTFEVIFSSPAFTPFVLTGTSKTLVMSFNLSNSGNSIVSFNESGSPYAYLNAAPVITVTAQ